MMGDEWINKFISVLISVATEIATAILVIPLATMTSAYGIKRNIKYE